MKITVPKKVAQALDHHHKLFEFINATDKNRIFLTLAFAPCNLSGQSLVLREFAREKPTLYIHALLHGYKAEVNIQEELAEMIDKWLNKEYVDNEKKDIEEFAGMIVEYFQQQT